MYYRKQAKTGLWVESIWIDMLRKGQESCRTRDNTDIQRACNAVVLYSDAFFDVIYTRRDHAGKRTKIGGLMQKPLQIAKDYRKSIGQPAYWDGDIE